MPAISLTGVTLDCLDPVTLAEFYRQLTGGEVVYSSPEFVYLAGNPVGLAFQRSDGYQAPSWPDSAIGQQAHLDFHVADPALLESIEAEVVALGARSAERQPRPQSWRVMLDPARHPFCLSSMS